ncbi:MAG: Lrp/AsnC family transcriptional regulator [Actinobacteria bacterium]|nr:Lrp/AsnC family transcriptional regulator [Actinomycetota bacterium]
MDAQTERILAKLREDGRASYSDLSRDLGMDRNLIARRVGELLDSGDLKIIASVHPEMLGLNLYVHLAIRVAGPIHDVVTHLTHTDAAILVTETTGAHQIVADLLLTDTRELHAHLQELRGRPGVVEIAVDVYEEVRDNFFRGWHPDASSASLDDDDLEIIRILRHDGRAAYARIAEQVGLSTSAVRSRVQRLVERHVIQIGAIPQRAQMNRDLLFGFGICVTESVEPAVEFLVKHSGLEFLATTTGRFDLIATVGFASLRELDALVTGLRALPTFASSESWLHTRIARERYDRTLGVLTHPWRGSGRALSDGRGRG